MIFSSRKPERLTIRREGKAPIYVSHEDGSLSIDPNELIRSEDFKKQLKYFKLRYSKDE